jgi:hypothetical protein
MPLCSGCCNRNCVSILFVSRTEDDGCCCFCRPWLPDDIICLEQEEEVVPLVQNHHAHQFSSSNCSKQYGTSEATTIWYAASAISGSDFGFIFLHSFVGPTKRSGVHHPRVLLLHYFVANRTTIHGLASSAIVYQSYNTVLGVHSTRGKRE